MYARTYHVGWLIRGDFRRVLVVAGIQFSEGRGGVFQTKATLRQHRALERLGL